MSIDPHVTLLTCGHTHTPMDRIIGGVRVVNTGSVGIPFDGDPRACYGLISNLNAEDPAAVQVQLRRIAYDIEAAVEHLYAHNHPAAELGAYNLRNGKPRGSSTFYMEKMHHAPDS
jgi:diadenosine tetraphosphatase ApaH/serine/threonine PP2A family protein phosphatase